MTDLTPGVSQIITVNSFKDLVTTPFYDDRNAVCWERKLVGDFAEIIDKVALKENMVVLEKEVLVSLQLSEQGELARAVLLEDLELLKAQGASPILNIIQSYERDTDLPFFPTDVYSFHVDRSPIPVDTFLCTYYGEPSDILPNAEGVQKVLIPEIRAALKKIYGGVDEGFESFLKAYFFDLHYQPLQGAHPIPLGLGNIWRIAVDHPESKVPPCLHRAPKEKSGEKRLLLIC
ncbi:hypothetical protein DNU06_09085 [Putridiphycobacter roseus]|uniref:DUF1826 domain-containing protein n=1 Tax=Putridiphycobacter roseus TaxID=2219161 RepID=A0A2W1N0X2_9FLAO|nr:hypothetical protein [Putridiphycobacter roseus]PZE17414.1 hypothetical protein DNU06_09085 [Putridiphycobacter roseus]